MIEAKTDEIRGRVRGARPGARQGGSVEALGYMKERLVGAHAERRRAIESGEQTVVGLNRYVDTERLTSVEGLDEHGVREDRPGRRGRTDRLARTVAERTRRGRGIEGSRRV